MEGNPDQSNRRMCILSEQSQSIRAIAIFDIDGVLRDVAGSYRRALADTVEQFTDRAYRPQPEDIDRLKSEGIWNNDWEGSQELVYRYFESQGKARSQLNLDYPTLVAFFQSRYFGSDPDNWTGYICHEPILVTPAYFHRLSDAGIAWGFFSGATRKSAAYVLAGRLELDNPVLIAMEDAPGKPDPTGLLATARQVEQRLDTHDPLPVIYAGDTVADLYTVTKANAAQPSRRWIGVGILPPHVQVTPQQRQAYAEKLQQAGAAAVFDNIEELTPDRASDLLKQEI
jgi:HAD superfamily phosphatase